MVLEYTSIDPEQELLDLQKKQNRGVAWTDGDRIRLLELQNAKAKETQKQTPHDVANALQRQTLAKHSGTADMREIERQTIIAESRRIMEEKADKLH